MHFNKIKAAGLCVVMAAALTVSACGNTDAAGTETETVTDAVTDDGTAEDKEAADEKAEEVYGTITSVSENSVTIDVTEEKDGEYVSTGESVTFEVTDSTEYSVERGSGNGRPEMPEMPSGEAPTGEAPTGEAPSGEMPEMPSGEAPTGEAPAGAEAPSGEMPEMPSGEAPTGEAPSGEMPEAPSGERPEMPGGMHDISIDSLKEGDQIHVVLGSDGKAESVSVIMSGGHGGAPGGMPGNGGSGNENIEYTALNEYTQDASETGLNINSTGTDENAVLVSGGNVTIDESTITRNSSDSTGGDSASFYGVGADVLNTGGTLVISDSTLTTDSKGGAGVFSYGEDAVTYVSDCDITTTQDTSGGIHAAGGGTLYAYDLDVTTNGESSAAIRSDRGGGTMIIDDGEYVTNGTGSPAIYSTADIVVNDADLTANNSEAICVEGSNSIKLYDCDLTGNMPDNDQNDCKWNVILYQSMSGDADEGLASFEMVGGTLTQGDGGLFYTTNTESEFILKDVDITTAADSDFFLKCTGNSNKRGWGESGNNGASCTFTGISQDMTGDVIWDSISNLDMYLTEGSVLKGAVYEDESNAGNGGEGYASVNIDSSSKWIVTGDSQVTYLNNAGTIVDENGNTVTVKDMDGNVLVQGTSEYTVSVFEYSEDVDTSNAGTVHSFAEYAEADPADDGDDD